MNFSSFDMTAAIIFAVIALIIGFIMGLLAGGGGGDDDKSMPKDADIDPNWVDAARFWWDKRNNDLVFRAGERTYLKGVKIKGAERKCILRILQELHTWVTQEPLPDLDPVASLRQMADEVPENRRSAMLWNPIDSVARAIQADIPHVTADPGSIVQQINEVLQEKLAHSNLKERGISLIEFPNRGMVVLIGLEQYDNIEDVPDEAIQTILRAAVADWEARAAQNES